MMSDLWGKPQDMEKLCHARARVEEMEQLLLRVRRKQATKFYYRTSIIAKTKPAP